MTKPRLWIALIVLYGCSEPTGGEHAPDSRLAIDARVVDGDVPDAIDAAAPDSSVPDDAPVPFDASPDAPPPPIDAPPMMPDAPPPPLDTDGDGVPNTADVCPTDPTATTTPHSTVEKLHTAKLNEDVADGRSWSFLSGAPYTSLSNVTLQSLRSDWLHLRQYNVAVPATAKILGIAVRIHRVVTSDDMTPVRDYDIRLYYSAGLRTPVSRASAAAWPVNVFQDAAYGGPADLWGRTWSAAEINGAYFGVGIRATIFDYPDPDDDAVGANPLVDAAGIIVTYCAQ